MAYHDNAARRMKTVGARRPQPIRNALFAHIVGQLLDADEPPSDSDCEKLIDALGLVLPAMDIAKRKAFAERINQIDQPPRRLIGMLARDDIEVASVLLGNNHRIRRSDLRTIAQTGTHSHRLVMAERDDLPAQVTDALIEYGDERVIHALTRNPKAAFSLKSLARLAANYRHIESVEAFLDQTLGPKEGAPQPVATDPPPIPVPDFQAPPVPAPDRRAAPAPAPASQQIPQPAATVPRPKPAPTPPAAAQSPPPRAQGKRRRAENIVRIRIEEIAPPPEADRALEITGETERAGDFSRAAADWTWETDRDGRFTTLSDRAVEAFGLPPASIAGKSFADFGEISRESNRWHDAAGAIARRSSFRDATFSARPRGGGRTMWSVSGVPTFARQDGRFLGYRGTAIETTVEHLDRELADKARQQLADTRAELERAGAEPAAGLRPAVDSDAGGVERLAGLSHELRTPLNAIIGFSDLIATRTRDTDEARYSEPAAAIRDAAWGLNSFVTDLLDGARIEAGTLELDRRPVLIHEAVSAAIAAADEEAATRNIEIRHSPVSADLLVEGDVDRIEQVLGKMLRYAATQSRPGGIVSLDARPAGVSAVWIDIGCDAPGPASADPEDVFQKVEQSSTIEQDMPKIAPGFALSFARQLARLMAGDLTVSLLEPGIRLRLQLPRANQP